MAAAMAESHRDMRCPHREVEAVLLYQGEPIGQICTHCFEMLPVAWGCQECEWLVVETLCGDRYYMVGAACSAHLDLEEEALQ